ncbi:MAG: hypothetical protein F2667_04385 [Actinobacteria bacterium]|uniref:Unannotated protein n=1 Tax=freshwater metagenome TaxID=449393 RepID=A0A6J6PSW3_9ZZZZ|nr:hypothetical protein [Actinomycetota bacterium]
MIFAHIDGTTVTNVIVADTIEVAAELAPAGQHAVDVTGVEAATGWEYDPATGAFIRPPDPVGGDDVEGGEG